MRVMIMIFSVRLATIDIMVRYYEDTFLKNASVNERDSRLIKKLKILSNNQEIKPDDKSHDIDQ